MAPFPTNLYEVKNFYTNIPGARALPTVIQTEDFPRDFIHSVDFTESKDTIDLFIAENCVLF